MEGVRGRAAQEHGGVGALEEGVLAPHLAQPRPFALPFQALRLHGDGAVDNVILLLLVVIVIRVLPGDNGDAVLEGVHVSLRRGAHVVDESVKDVGGVSEGGDVDDRQAVGMLVVVGAHQRQSVAQEVTAGRVAVSG